MIWYPGAITSGFTHILRRPAPPNSSPSLLFFCFYSTDRNHFTTVSRNCNGSSRSVISLMTPHNNQTPSPRCLQLRSTFFLRAPDFPQLLLIYIHNPYLIFSGFISTHLRPARILLHLPPLLIQHFTNK